MGILEEVIGAVVAVEGVKKLDPNASIFTEGIAAIAGYKGVEAITERLENKEDDNKDGDSEEGNNPQQPA
ncbi:hypothetical protein SAMN04515620_11057 [Collimonas sp. OK607]|uniref:hypothetical protein n=1 Tax=Collimonas sp. OK607 TaxID=1798194 RepID=UPI0008EA7B59|nr:hypothetical protein [Collimonas sp. OK607]SFA97023.1 hypothetical protein SAMN04515620_11057 [Collimonas sp. OK607]